MEEKKMVLSKEELHYIDKGICDVLNILINTKLDEKQEEAYNLLKEVHYKVGDYYLRES